MFKNGWTNSQKGLSLLELSIAMAIAAAIAILQVKKNISDLEMDHLKTESTWVIGALDDIKAQLGQSADYSGLSDLTLGSIRSIPKSYIDSTNPGRTTVINGFNGEIHAGPLGLDGVNNAFALTYSGVSRDACSKFVILLHAIAKTKAPTFSIVGEMGVSKSVPVVSLSELSRLTLSPAGRSVLQYSGKEDLDVLQLANFCSYIDATTSPLRSITLIRRP